MGRLGIMPGRSDCPTMAKHWQGVLDPPLHGAAKPNAPRQEILSTRDESETKVATRGIAVARLMLNKLSKV